MPVDAERKIIQTTHQLQETVVVYPMIYKGFGCLGFCPSIVVKLSSLFVAF